MAQTSGANPPGIGDRAPAAPPPGAGPANRWAVLVVLCASLFLVALDATVLHVAIPAVSADLRPGPIELLWIVDVYPLICASLLILFGTLGDRIGRRRVLLMGYACFGVASALAACSTSAPVLIGARALLGVGGAMIMPATLSILRHVFPDRRERAMAIGIWSAVAAVGAAVGPLVAGILLEHFWWGSVFLLNIPLMAICLPVGARLLPESRGRVGTGPWDVPGALIAAAGLFCVILAVKRVGGGHLWTPWTLLVGVAGAVLLVTFVRRQRSRAHPLIDLSAFSRPAFGTSVGCIVLTVLALVGLALIAAQYLQLVLGLTPLQTGLRLLPLSLAAIAAGLMGAWMLRLMGPRLMISGGFLLTALAVLLLLQIGHHDNPPLLITGFVLLGFGLETTLFGSYESMINDAPADQAGEAASLGETAYQFGAGLGIALLGSVMNAVYAPAVRAVGGLEDEERVAVGHSLAEARAIADAIGGDTGAELHTAAVNAFVAGTHAALAASALLLLIGALAALRLPREPMSPAAGTEGARGADTDVTTAIPGGAAVDLAVGDYRHVASSGGTAAPQPTAPEAPHAGSTPAAPLRPR
ncbi:MFS transporter [Streptomyces alkaliphilus]|uniref:MFS transporter n=1 Tax=Streptomyces alkaliphilus TaxID=1472722 RepID=UPI00117FD3D5|nr:MFS transporter [Streptomyces alkaliphilus]MQS07988.1 MFS transporter [Streptomyces alkaliphilus]